MQTVCILGRQPDLGIAELESRFGAAAVIPLEYTGAAALDIDPAQFNIDTFGGTVKVARLVKVLNTTLWREIAGTLMTLIPQHLADLPEDGKLKLGMSAYGLKVHSSELSRTGLELKKIIKKTGRSVRIVPNANLALSSATVQHNQLTGEMGCELILVGDGKRTIIAQTFAIQDIEAYAARDQVRPMRDARVGMLPPKLAQIIINLAIPDAKRLEADDITLLDPFCGTGVILQEALLLGYQAIGTDLEPRMVEYSVANLNWLSEKHHIQETFHVSQGDATDTTWQQHITAVASETYLGKALSSMPARGELESIVNTGDKIHSAFLKNIAPQIVAGTRLCLAIPAWHVASDNFRILPFQQNLGKLGFKRVNFTHVDTADLIYYRPEQFVGRQLLTIERI